MTASYTSRVPHATPRHLRVGAFGVELDLPPAEAELKIRDSGLTEAETERAIAEWYHVRSLPEPQQEFELRAIAERYRPPWPPAPFREIAPGFRVRADLPPAELDRMLREWAELQQAWPAIAEAHLAARRQRQAVAVRVIVPLQAYLRTLDQLRRGAVRAGLKIRSTCRRLLPNRPAAWCRPRRSTARSSDRARAPGDDGDGGGDDDEVDLKSPVSCVTPVALYPREVTMGTLLPVLLAREAQAVLELALEANCWPWSRRLSFWLDALIVLEEEGGASRTAQILIIEIARASARPVSRAARSS